MTHEEYTKLAENFADYARVRVEFKHDTPNFHDHSTGILLGIGMSFKDTIIIGHLGTRLAIHYSNVKRPQIYG